MRKLTYLAAAAAISSLALAANPASANPLAGGLTDRSLSTVELNDGLVQKVHRWHCRKRFGLDDILFAPCLDLAGKQLPQ